MNRQTLRDGVHRFNAAGPLGLLARTARLSEEQEAELAALDAARSLSGR